MVTEFRSNGTLTLHWSLQALIAGFMVVMGGTGDRYLLPHINVETVSLQEHQRVVSIQDENTRRIEKLESKFDVIETQQSAVQVQLATIHEDLQVLEKRIR